MTLINKLRELEAKWRTRAECFRHGETDPESDARWCESARLHVDECADDLSRLLAEPQHKPDCDVAVWPKGVPCGDPEQGYHIEPVECTCGAEPAEAPTLTDEEWDEIHDSLDASPRLDAQAHLDLTRKLAALRAAERKG